jgi:hypothetical protein
MHRLQLLDTFPAFEGYWRTARSQSLDVQINGWEHEYLGAWPELLELQKRSYSRERGGWRKIAKTRIFPHLTERLPQMRRIHHDLVRRLPGDWASTKAVLKLDFQVQFVVYVGLGVGAGRATRLAGRPACLFGLENAAEMISGSGDGSPVSVAHEVAHLVHDEWRGPRAEVTTSAPRGPYGQLYTEGFATECERQVESPRRFRLRTGRADWLAWCSSHRAWLARRFLRDVAAHRSVRPFFGSWYNVRGQIECGYFLGQQVIQDWLKTNSLVEIARLPESEIPSRTRRTLQRMAET